MGYINETTFGSVKRPGGGPDLTFIQSRKLLEWENSSRVNGHLVLRSNPHTRYKSNMGSVYPINDRATMKSAPQGGIDQPEINKHLRGLSNEVFAKFRGKIYEGNAALGVTAASMKQSRSMINARYNQLNKSAAHALVDIEGLAREGGRRNSKRVASAYLEYLFGWSPLVQDVHNAVTSVVQKADQRTFVRSTSTRYFKESVTQRDPWGPGFRDDFEGSLRMSYSASVTIANPNLWLAERAGTVNIAAIAWDIVPWSFVVNMFTNVGSIVNSITDYSGLELGNTCLTTTCRNTWTGTHFDSLGDTCRAYGVVNHKRQTVGISPPTPTLEFKLPDVSWETAAMAASLFTQKLGAISRLVRAVF